MAITPGRRVRILLEHYDPQMTENQAQVYLAAAREILDHCFPGKVVATYVEENPPADELA